MRLSFGSTIIGNSIANLISCDYPRSGECAEEECSTRTEIVEKEFHFLH